MQNSQPGALKIEIDEINKITELLSSIVTEIEGLIYSSKPCTDCEENLKPARITIHDNLAPIYHTINANHERLVTIRDTLLILGEMKLA